MNTVRERAPAKVNLLLHVGPARADGLHEICSLFASVELADELRVARTELVGEAALIARPVRDDRDLESCVPAEPDHGGDIVWCEGVDGSNLVHTALAAFRRQTGANLPALAVSIEKRIPIAGGLGGGSADAAAALRIANELAGRPLGPDALRRIGATVGADVPSQIQPGHALVTGSGEVVEPIELPPMTLVLVPQAGGLRAAEVYAEADRLGSPRPILAPAAVRALAAQPLEALATRLQNDLEPAVLSLRPDLERPLGALRRAGALAALVTGSGPTVFGVFRDRAAAAAAAAEIPGALVAALRSGTM